MPIVAVAGALIAGAIAAPAVGGLIAGTALTLSSALEITAAVGATLGAVGAVTRDKNLQTAGLVLGGIGGVGSLASAAGLIDGSTELFGASASTADAAALPAGAMSADVAGNVSDAAAAGLPAGAMSPEGFTGDLVDTMSGVVSPAAEAPLVPPTSSIDPAPQSDAEASANLGSTPASVPPAAVTTGTDPVTGAPTASATPEDIPDALLKSKYGFGDDGTVSGILKKIGDFSTSSPLVSYGLIQAGGSLVGGMFSPITPAQVNQMNANAANYRAQSGLTTQQTENIRSGVPSATRLPQRVQASVTGAPAPVTGAGLINNLPPNNPSAGAGLMG